MNNAQTKLYHYLVEQSPRITDDWLNAREINGQSVFSRDAGVEMDRQLREENRRLVTSITKAFIEDEDSLHKEWEAWIELVSDRRLAQDMPLHEAVQQFRVVREVYYNYIKEFSKTHDEVTVEDILHWNDLVNSTFDWVITQFLKRYNDKTEKEQQRKQTLINELSSPVIPITEDAAILPLMGDLDTERTAYIHKNTLEHCNEYEYDTIYIDLSGVHNIDTLVAHRIFQLIDSLKLLGVTTILCGLKPRIAQVAVNLGLDFTNIQMKSKLSHALQERMGDLNTSHN
ncbi:hypothetical protein N781_01930 [Pontibacillus halophilus JSM 076056 = DSM 19796]|uniref:STAS domain-containing protein n=1 Tax=Pontibacillus halophilus JSM 076056 = DSM 19796 TaxID=1385510 RepID=A0A0A5GS83_9BACI|nr:STAS domain-containing protein [Pontibacillus halophilus]KGX94098.1 hypothetical protein N781_01930 [Pontibacillus halophilus JSM 076056 = DSM 19796]